MNEANKLNENDFEDMKKYYRAWDKVFKQERKKITKDILQNIQLLIIGIRPILKNLKGLNMA